MLSRDIYGRTVEVGNLVVVAARPGETGIRTAIVCKLNPSSILVSPIDTLDDATYRVKQVALFCDVPTEKVKDEIGEELYNRWIEERKDLGFN